ncbi:P52 family lipoprotein (plasmid) [Borreliella carolinensis]|nr:P52 family lipoprotein [Borreliella carolinensis]WNY63319.1 P52 family lipoprotein [Borreliella carolinensis]
MVENVFKYLKLDAIEICLLKDIKRVIYNFYESILDLENDLEIKNILSPNKSKNILNEFFCNLGAKYSKELINLFRKIKVNLGNNVFENEVFIFYLSISDINFFKFIYVLSSNNFDDYSILIYEKFNEIKENLNFKLSNCSLDNL